MRSKVVKAADVAPLLLASDGVTGMSISANPSPSGMLHSLVMEEKQHLYPCVGCLLIKKNQIGEETAGREVTPTPCVGFHLIYKVWGS
ncbi:unnamed protein product [Lactuca virosa]|uniref:Uncharacterized protein n=1 Tax=Lactuca virosa TaxID=75947 RepID=A0AAU9NN66_9ASTR|nr:unnamed protein product [Lactuca virosa]